MCDLTVNIHADGKVDADCTTHMHGWGTQLMDDLYPRLMDHFAYNGLITVAYKELKNV